ncbi:unnamed protein product, partial [marine sediment metagenome]
PFYIDKLKNLPGTNEKIEKYVAEFPITQHFIEVYFNLLSYLIPYYVKEGKTYLSIAFGCTGGRHRSVVLINNLANYLEGKEYKLFVKHRDMNKDEIKIKNDL